MVQKNVEVAAPRVPHNPIFAISIVAVADKLHQVIQIRVGPEGEDMHESDRTRELQAHVSTQSAPNPRAIPRAIQHATQPAINPHSTSVQSASYSAK